MGCDVFNAAKSGVQFFNVEIGDTCPVEEVCGQDCLMIDSSGTTSRGQALGILLNNIWGKERVDKFYRRLSMRENLPAVIVARIRTEIEHRVEEQVRI